jgi:Fic family protein
MESITVSDLAAVVYSSGKVFNGLETGRLDTENFLRSGSTEGVTSRSDLHLLQDLRDVAGFVVSHTTNALDARYIMALNGVISRSGAIRAGELRRTDQGIGVSTRFGRHEPPALTEAELDALIASCLAGADPLDNALMLFVALAKAQPFEDGNKRTALFAANGYLICAGSSLLVTVPVDDDDPSVAAAFNQALARAYIHGETTDVIRLLRAAVIER